MEVNREFRRCETLVTLVVAVLAAPIILILLTKLLFEFLASR